jgi:transcriptional regulator with XRE-family HTH domain
MREHGETPRTLRAWRTERLLSTRRLADLAGTSNKTIVQLENGRQIASFVTIEKVCRVLKVEPRDVREFALALDTRAGTAINEFAEADVRTPSTHVCCVSQRPALLSLTRRLLAEETYGVTTIIGVPVTVEQIAGVRPDVLVLELGGAPSLALLRCLQRDTATSHIPIVVTGQHPQWLEAVAAELPSIQPADGTAVRIAPFNRDLRALMAAVSSAVERS